MTYYAGNPKVLKDCPICGAKDGRCRERDAMILCMGRVSGTKGERIGDYEYRNPTKDGQWGVWLIPLENKTRLKQLSNDRIQFELTQAPYDASPNERDECYSDVLSQLGLAACDRADLEARGLTQQQIADVGFKSVEKWQTLPDEVNWRVPGIGPSGRSLYTPWDGGGYLCPVRDVDGRIVAMQVRLRRPDNGGRYRWLSSSDSRRPSRPLTQIEGEIPLAIYQPEGCDRKHIWLVEGTGPKPAITAYRLNSLVIGASGAQWSGSPHYLKQALDRIKPETIILGPDAGSIGVDKHGHQHTLGRYSKLRDLLKDWGYELEVAWWGQDIKPETANDKLRAGDIDEISEINFELISFDSLRTMAAKARQAWEQITGNLDAIGRPIPGPQVVPEPAPMPEDTPTPVKIRRAVEHYMKVSRVSDPFTVFDLERALYDEFKISKTKLQEFCNYLASEERTGEGLTPTSDILIDTFAEIEQRSNGVALPGVPCGFYDLDATTQGFQRSDLIIAAGRPSMGKTTLCMNVARNVAVQQKLPVAIFSLEMSKLQLVYRLLSAEVEIESSRLRAGRVGENEWGKMGHGISTLSKAPIYIDGTPGISVAEMRSRAARLQAAHGGSLGLILIDYLQLMDGGSGGSGNRVQELSHITRSLKGMARELNVPVIALSQLSRGVESRADKRPMMSDLRESGSIEQDADLIMMLYREEYYTPDTADRGIAEVIITKHRNGPTGNVRLLFEPQFTRFRNLSTPEGGF